MKRWIPWLILIPIFCIFFYHLIHYFPKLPMTVASHFDFQGHPNGSSSKLSFFGLYGFLVGTFFISFFLFPLFLHLLPPSLLNIPNREYWLTPARKEKTLDSVLEMTHWLGVLSLIFMVTIFQLVIEANLVIKPQLSFSPIWLFLGLYLVGILGFILRFHFVFKLPPNSEN